MKPDLKSMTRKELEKLKANVEKALVRVATKEKKAALAAAEKAAAAHGFSLAAITDDAPAKKTTRKTKPGTVSRLIEREVNPASAKGSSDRCRRQK